MRTSISELNQLVSSGTHLRFGIKLVKGPSVGHVYFRKGILSDSFPR